ncbi:MAG TPA: flagellar biosynthetic protein FliO [Rheinheimera sp.]|uniref:flagellar biosynthetic protein FliO n=1 Tax=Rheinheimera sp. TaxID=1869214 RepID=UPI002F95A7FC
MRLFYLALCCMLLLPVTLNAQTQAEDTVADVTADSPAENAATDNSTAVLPATPAEVPAEPAAAQPLAKVDNSTQRPSAGLGLGKMAFSLAIVVAIVVALGWAFKKLTLRLPGSRHIKIISAMPLGPKERLLVIEMQGKQRVLGVTSQSINLLFELENPLPEEKLASDFHTQLQSFLKK